MDAQACHSCGGHGDDLQSVRRVYVTPAAWDRDGRVDVVDEPEHWCAACRSQYQHQPLAG